MYHLGTCRLRFKYKIDIFSFFIHQVIHVRFIKSPIKVEDSIPTEKRIQLSEPACLTESSRKRRPTSAYGSPPGPKRAVPKSLTVSQMIRLGKLIKPSGETVVIEIYPFDFTTLSWFLRRLNSPLKVKF